MQPDAQGEHVEYDEFAMFHENAEEFGLPFDRPPVVRRTETTMSDGRTMSSLVWGDEPPQLVLIHGGGQNAHTWDTVAMALGRPLLAVDLPGHGHSDAGAGSMTPETFASDIASVIDALAPNAAAVVGMSLGGLTTVALTAARPDLVRRIALVDITPGVTPQKSVAIANFVRGPATFASLDDLLARTIEHNPGRSVSSLRRGILHNALQLDDGSWIWRYRRHNTDGLPGMQAVGPGAGGDGTPAGGAFTRLWDVIDQSTVPMMLARGMRPQSVVDDADVAELLRRRPDCQVHEFPDAGHSIQGDSPVELARVLDQFLSS